MMKYIQTDTQQEVVDLKSDLFQLGAPFTAVLFNNHWDEESKGVYASDELVGGTFALDSEFEHEGSWCLKHIDEYVFAPYTFGYYQENYPDNEGIQTRIPKDENEEPDPEWLDKTPQQYVSEVLIGTNFTIIELP